MRPTATRLQLAAVLLLISGAIQAQTCTPSGSLPSMAPLRWQGDTGLLAMNRVTPTCDVGFYDDLWSYVAPCDSVYEFELTRLPGWRGAWPLLEIYDGDPCLGGNSLGCDMSWTPRVGPLALAAGAEVWILVDGFYSQFELYPSYGPYELAITGSGCMECAITAPSPGQVLSGVVTVGFDALDPQGDPLDVTLEYSTDNGVTFQPMTAAAGSPLPNPATGVPSGAGKSFSWDCLVDLPCTPEVRAYVPHYERYHGGTECGFDYTGVVAVLDTSTGTISQGIHVGGHAVGVAVSPASRTVYVTNSGSGDVSVIDTVTGAVVAAVPVGASPAGVAVCPRTACVYVANQGSGTVSVIDPATLQVAATIPVGGEPYGVAVSPGGSFVYVTDIASDQVLVIETATSLVVAAVPVGSAPKGIAVSPSGEQIHVANAGAGTVSVIETATLQNVATVTVSTAVQPTSDNAYGVVFSPDGLTAYATNPTEGTVHVIDTGAHTVVMTIPGVVAARGVSVSPDGAQVFVAGRDPTPGSFWCGFGPIALPSGMVYSIDTATGAILSEVESGFEPGYALGSGIATLEHTPPVHIRVTLADGVSTPVRCSQGPFEFRNCSLGCGISSPAGAWVGGEVTLAIDGTDDLGLPLTSTFEYSTDAGITWSAATPALGSPTPNPDPMRPTPIAGRTFAWDSLADGVGTAGPAAVDFRMTVDDTYRQSTCGLSLTVEGGPGSACAECGDCNLDGAPLTVLDSLASAQIASGVLVPQPVQLVCCDVNSSASVTVIDALIMAQLATGLPLTPMCP